MPGRWTLDAGCWVLGAGCWDASRLTRLHFAESSDSSSLSRSLLGSRTSDIITRTKEHSGPRACPCRGNLLCIQHTAYSLHHHNHHQQQQLLQPLPRTIPFHSIPYPISARFSFFLGLELWATILGFHHHIHRSGSICRSGAQTPRSPSRKPGRQCGSEQAYAISTLFRPCIPASLRP